MVQTGKTCKQREQTEDIKYLGLQLKEKIIFEYKEEKKKAIERQKQ